MRTGSNLALAAALSLGLSSAGSAQGPQAPPAQPAGQATFRVSIDLVTSDVIVRNRQGQFVSDLTKDDFQVFEDGVKQDISSFVLVHGGRAYTTQVAAAPPPQEGIILPPARPTNDAAGRIFAFFVDDLHMDFGDTPRIRTLFKKMAKELVHDGDLFGIVSTGTSSISIDLTYDRSRLDEVSNKITGGGLRPSEVMMRTDSPQGPSEVRHRAQVAFATAYELLKNLEKVHNRRKAVIYVSSGYDFDPFASGRLESRMIDPSLWGQRFADSDLAGELAELTHQANRANATIYSLDPRGLVGGPDIDESVDPGDWASYVRKSQDSLRVLAEETGGVAVVNTNDFDKALKRIDAETSDYYVLGYYSKNPDPTQRNGSIEMKVVRATGDAGDLDLLYRKAYALRPSPTPVSTDH